MSTMVYQQDDDKKKKKMMKKVIGSPLHKRYFPCGSSNFLRY